MAWAAARRSLAAFRISIALGSSTGSTAGAGAFCGALAGFFAGGTDGCCCAYPLVARHTPNASSSMYLRDLSRIIRPPDEHTFDLWVACVTCTIKSSDTHPCAQCTLRSVCQGHVVR